MATMIPRKPVPKCPPKIFRAMRSVLFQRLSGLESLEWINAKSHAVLYIQDFQVAASQRLSKFEMSTGWVLGTDSHAGVLGEEGQARATSFVHC
eukprot:175674-Amphidinium_carterae.1